MIAARVAGVPSPQSFMARESSLSSSDLPAVSIAVSKVASLNRLGGRVCFSLHDHVAHGLGGVFGEARGEALLVGVAVLLAHGDVEHFPSGLDHGGADGVEAVDDRIGGGDRGRAWRRRWRWGDVTAVMTVVTAQMCSSCHAISSRRQIRS